MQENGLRCCRTADINAFRSVGRVLHIVHFEEEAPVRTNARGTRPSCRLCSTNPRRLRVFWPKVKFTEIELVDPYHENDVQKAPTPHTNKPTEIVVDPGAIVTLTNTALER